ncbi:endoproteinase ArgC [Xanthomonas oryzae pv. oryzae]|uniref:trypsin-like serine peptidase n=1 Tax=Xanthomonas oryzae TaxID=347 RepID=UPI000949DC0A|nr:trypsin-like peptidase domain-containing protein [Xanthomonas oryzae]OLG45665.1 endoproteinase ArgC [Xanthomonas oryzae pv. oryzae]OLG49381.1 endoproteinase ArgC [Xanthomonas oryzae pv. oryzae]OLG55177.1 endoproteinase ArgC [Xanthomonas oryzae pv. oryzae]OLG65015.1 endoproteinase ArgC [Xanthomonas oryzae pv. oryzae]OLG71416.1 endoproteinase ArgC [Xanthomonas oryzae pv. oryzae]
MYRHNAFCLALLSAVSLPALAVPPAEMDAAPVSAAPQPAQPGAASLQSADVRGGLMSTQVAHLAAPTEKQLNLLRERRIAQLKHGHPLQIGFSRAVPRPRVNMAALDWQLAGNGRRVATLKLSSAKAASLRAALMLRGAGATPGTPSRVVLRFAGNDGHVFERSGADFVTAGDAIGWSPVVDGEDLLIEIALPAGQYPENFSLSIPQLSHLDISPGANTQDFMASAIGNTSSCERDIVCRAHPTRGFLDASSAVARMVITDSNGSFSCTGTLLNNANSPKRHLFWTASHCVSTQSVANTLQTYWFYDAARCNSTTVSTQATTLSGGAVLRYVNSTRDISLLELRSAPPPGAFYAGWSSVAIAAIGTPIVGIHHPNNALKKYSLGTVTALKTSYEDKSPLYQVHWHEGVTEDGSSGAGLFTVASNGAYQLRGGLFDGTSSCAARRDPDYYSRFSDVYPSISRYFGK